MKASPCNRWLDIRVRWWVWRGATWMMTDDGILAFSSPPPKGAKILVGLPDGPVAVAGHYVPDKDHGQPATSCLETWIGPADVLADGVMLDFGELPYFGGHANS